MKHGDSQKKPAENFTPYGKVPPQATELERAVLGAILLERDKLEDVMDIIKSEIVFYKEEHIHIYKAVLQLYSSGMPVDLLTVTDQLNKNNVANMPVSWAYYLSQLTMDVVSSAHVEAHARLVFEKYMKREIIRIGGLMQQKGYDDGNDPFDMMNLAEKELYSILSGTIKTNYKHVSSYARKALEEIHDHRISGKTVNGIPTGFPALDRLTKGWQPADFIVIAARPSVGKTAFALNLAMYDASYGIPTGFFSLEMSVVKLMHRAYSSVSRVSLDSITLGKLTDDEMKHVDQAAARVASWPLYFDETSGINIHELRSKARKMVKKNGVKQIFIDYLQLMSGVESNRPGNREQEVSKISRDLKALAKELNIPIIALSQMNRDGEKQGAKREPQLSDLRESGAIEQDADLVAFLYREAYQKDERDLDPMTAHNSFMKVAKHRNGKTMKLAFKTVLDIQTWFDPNQYDEYMALSQLPFEYKPPTPSTDNLPF